MVRCHIQILRFRHFLRSLRRSFCPRPREITSFDYEMSDFGFFVGVFVGAELPSPLFVCQVVISKNDSKLARIDRVVFWRWVRGFIDLSGLHTSWRHGETVRGKQPGWYVGLLF